MKFLFRPAVCAALVFIVYSCSSADGELYKDPEAPVEKRVGDLMSRMTLEEKIGQMNQLVGIEHIRLIMSQKLTPEQIATSHAAGFYPNVGTDSIRALVREGKVGSFLHVYTLEEANSLQKLAMDSRLGIPLIFGIDAVHGNANCPDNTVYPTNIGLASTFDTTLAYTIARQTAREMRAMNMHWTFSPNAEISRDARWGRTGETFGEDPYLVGEMAYHSIRGYQGQLDSEEDVAACIKHLIGGGQPYNGINSAPADLSERMLREAYFPPFVRGLQAGPLSVMPAHNEVSGVPCHANRWLLGNILRKEWKFGGVIISDWDDIERLAKFHHIAAGSKEAYAIAIDAGLDMHMHGPEWNQAVKELVEDGVVSEKRIDESVRRILTMKFRLGLFENPYASPEVADSVRLCEEHRKTSLEASRKSVVLLKNDGVLPLKSGVRRRIMVTGINADDPNMMGDWTAEQRPENYTTILEGLKEIAPENNYVFIDQGKYPMKMKRKNVHRAVSEARRADINIVVAGDYMFRYLPEEMTCGENADRSDIALPGLQNELVEGIIASGKPTIVILVSGRPLGVENISEKASALLEAWEPGMYGGQAIAEILFGRVNPSGKLPITIPRSVGQVAIYYNHKPSAYIRHFMFAPITPLYPFGYGLSYSKYEYSEPILSSDEMAPGGSITASVSVRNTGNVPGDEIVQLYIRDRISSVTRPVKELKDFARVHLEPGESRTVSFKVTIDKLKFYNADMQYIAEPGEFEIMVGPSSADEDLKTIVFKLK